MSVATISEQVTIGGIAFGSTINRTEEGVITHTPTLAAGIAGTLSTRTDADTGILTVEAGHGITTADFLDVYWIDADGELQVQYKCDVTAQDATTITIDLGVGDDLPAQGYAIVAGKRVEIDSDFDGDLMKVLAIACDKNCHVHFEEEDGTSILPQKINGGESYRWVSEQDVGNPLTGNPVGQILVSCGEAAAAKLKIGVLYNSVS